MTLPLATGALLALSCAIAAALLVWAVRELARRRALLDHPNERSSHAVPRPRMGGIGIVLPVLAVGGWLVASGRANGAMLLPLAGTAVIAALGLWDDLRPLPARVRLAVQVAVAALVVGAAWARLPAAAGLLGGLLPVPVLAALAVLWVVWLTNLYNFMDGIDGLAGSQAVLAALALAFVASRTGADATAVLLVAVAGASLGFLLFNLPPSSIFMGDVGSTTLGFLLACVPLLPEARPVTLEPVAIALSLFILDATGTLLRRVARRENLAQAHRSHLYQRPVVAGVPHGVVLAWSLAGMTLVALCAMAWPSATGRLQGVLLAIPLVLFGVARSAVARHERRVEPGRSSRVE